jgi:hypothetical protein
MVKRDAGAEACFIFFGIGVVACLFVRWMKDAGQAATSPTNQRVDARAARADYVVARQPPVMMEDPYNPGGQVIRSACVHESSDWAEQLVRKNTPVYVGALHSSADVLRQPIKLVKYVSGGRGREETIETRIQMTQPAQWRALDRIACDGRLHVNYALRIRTADHGDCMVYIRGDSRWYHDTEHSLARGEYTIVR